MGKWFKIPCEKCDETGKICDDCEGYGTVGCDVCSGDDDNCFKCSGTDEVDCTNCVECSACEGNGFTEVFIDDCPECHNGTVECDCTGGIGKHAADEDCYACGGKGEHSCPRCNGTGYDTDDLEEHGINPDYL